MCSSGWNSKCRLAVAREALWLKPILAGALVVDMTSQEDLAALWLNAPEDRLCGREQAKAWALREVWRADGKGKHGMLTFIASKLQKTKDSLPQGDPPGVCCETVSEFESVWVHACVSGVITRRQFCVLPYG